MLIDTHIHLEMEQFDADRDEVLVRARKAGVSAIITIASTFESNEQAEALAQRLLNDNVGTLLHNAHLWLIHLSGIRVEMNVRVVSGVLFDYIEDIEGFGVVLRLDYAQHRQLNFRHFIFHNSVSID